MTEIEWPEDVYARIEAKIDNLRDNHLAHLAEDIRTTNEQVQKVDKRVSAVEKGLFNVVQDLAKKQRWSFYTGLLTLIMVLIILI